MIEFLHRLLLGHNHKWKVIDRAILYDTPIPGVGQLATGKKYILQCEICGKVKFKTIV